MSNLETRFLELDERAKTLERSIRTQRILHDSHKRGCSARHHALQDILVRVEKQRDEAWQRIEELEQQLRDALQRRTDDPNDDNSDYVFEAHLEGMDCGRSHCVTCKGESATGG